MMVSAEPEDAWAYCYPDDLTIRTRGPVNPRLTEPPLVASE